MRWAHDGVVGVRQLARHLELDHVRGEGGAEGGSDTDEDERTGARRILLCLYECLVGLRLGLETVQIHSCQGLSSINVRTQAQDRQAAARCTASARAGQQGQGTARAGQRAAHGYASRSCVGILDSCWRATAAAHLVSNRLLHRVEKKRLRAGCNRHSAQGEGTGQGSDRAGQQVQRTGRMRRACVSGDGVGAYRPWVVYRRGWCTSQKSGYPCNRQTSGGASGKCGDVSAAAPSGAKRVAVPRAALRVESRSASRSGKQRRTSVSLPVSEVFCGPQFIKFTILS